MYFKLLYIYVYVLVATFVEKLGHLKFVGISGITDKLERSHIFMYTMAYESININLSFYFVNLLDPHFLFQAFSVQHHEYWRSPQCRLFFTGLCNYRDYCVALFKKSLHCKPSDGEIVYKF